MRFFLTAPALLLALVVCAVPAAALPLVSHAALVTTQLPRSVRPTHYDVAITPDAMASRFTGHVAIDISVVTPTSSITLNAAGLDFSNIVLRSTKTDIQPVATTVGIDAANQIAIFTFASMIGPGNYQLVLDYSGTIGTQPVGLFALDYDTVAGRRRALYTQFENSDARRMIPSWDEPVYKASFALQVTVPANQLAVSNMPVEKSTVLTNGKVLVQFMRTPKMSTYLLFFGVGEFDRAVTRVDGIELGVVTQKGALSEAQFALDSSAAVLREYNDYFGVRFPLPKLDNIAAPGRSQFFGAMENWGAIFTFEHAILLNPAMSTQNDKQRAFAIAAHEMAHQWFGDLVTMQWWDDLWLNEGFASWMESRTTARLHPEWNTALEAVSVREHAMNRDALVTTHPVVQHVASVEQASQAFDSITYQKGESVIRMLENYVGADVWRNGVRAYMKTYAYGNTETNDLWRAIETAAGKPITAIAHDFTLQPGVPLIRVDSVTCKGGNSLVTLSQREFSRDQPDKVPLAWRVPVSVEVGVTKKRASVLVAGGKASLRVAACGPVLVNAGQNGYYRTAYAPAVFPLIAASFTTLSPIDQLGLLSDTWALGLNGMQPSADFFDLVQATPLAAAPQVWSNIASTLASIDQYYKIDAARQKRFALYAIGRLAPKLDQLGWIAAADEPPTVAPLREQLIGVLSALNDPATIAEARRRYSAAASTPASLPAALYKVVMRVVAAHADTATWEALHQLARTEASPMLKNDLYDLLALPLDQSLAQQALVLALTEEPGATNSAAMLGRVSEAFPDLAFDFALANMARVNDRIDPNSRSRYYPRLASASGDPAMVDKLSAFATANLTQDARRDADTAIASIRDRIKIRGERLPSIDAWLKSHAG